MENENKRLHEWFGLCCHDIKGGIVRPARCAKDCGFRVSIAEWRLMNEQANLDFSTESGFFALLSGLRAKGFKIEIISYSDGRLPSYIVIIGNKASLEVTADTLPLALFNAALKALDAETSGEGTE